MISPDALEAEGHDLIARGHACLARARRLRSEVERSTVRVDVGAAEWIDQYASPLGKRRHLAEARRGTFPSTKIGKRVLVRRADLEAFLAAHRRGEPACEQAPGIFSSLGGCR